MIRKGTYILILEMPEARIRVGALGIVNVPKGTYCYVGSAMNGLDQRIGRHLSKGKKIRWHIDRLTEICTQIEAYEAATQEITECGLGKLVLESGGSGFVKGFGCSDCRCFTHLFLLNEKTKEKLCSSSSLVPHLNL
ncbi:MAG: GIY-YIG nuclease family protein [Candidatus Methanoplasma sp.]|jgi:Uri superfamily endonuclease|nr:GIY-YIG nuclease family protein [Candidatus Methanoplasma sp.]